jgi:hypothetical protein
MGDQSAARTTKIAGQLLMPLNGIAPRYSDVPHVTLLHGLPNCPRERVLGQNGIDPDDSSALQAHCALHHR